jgi:hypothetical protein
MNLLKKNLNLRNKFLLYLSKIYFPLPRTQTASPILATFNAAIEKKLVSSNPFHATQLNICRKQPGSLVCWVL